MAGSNQRHTKIKSSINLIYSVIQPKNLSYKLLYIHNTLSRLNLVFNIHCRVAGNGKIYHQGAVVSTTCSNAEAIDYMKRLVDSDSGIKF